MDEGGKQQGKFVKTKENKRSSKELREGMQSREGAWVKAFIENWKKTKTWKRKIKKPEVDSLLCEIKQSNLFVRKIKNITTRAWLKYEYNLFKMSHDWLHSQLLCGRVSLLFTSKSVFTHF